MNKVYPTIKCYTEQYVKKLQEENKQLKEDIETFKFTITTQQQMIDELIGKLDKAIEYIKDMQDSCIVFSNITYKELLEILGDKE